MPIARQRGAALMLFAAVVVLGVVTLAVGALGKAGKTDAERETKTGLALQAAKQALLGYVALRAADSSEDYPGRLPCPETLNQAGTASEGVAAPFPAYPTCTSVGRLPWRTLGIDQPRDGYGEPLWYVVTPGTWALQTSSTTLTLNPGVQGSLTYDGQPNAAVALIIAPGVPLNTMSDAGTPAAPCGKVNQFVTGRNTAPLVAGNFLECGNISGNYANPGTSQWTNDRVIAITATEVMDAIAGAVADRLQRQVAPALSYWDQAEFTARGKSWGITYGLPYLPFASVFTDPATNDYCGNAGATPTREGLPPTASTSSAACSSAWTGSASLVLGLANQGCTQTGTMLRCRFQRLFGAPPFSIRITATAANVANSFRGTLDASDITVTGGGSISISPLSSLSSTTGGMTLVLDATWPITLALLQTVEVRIPNLPDAAVLSDPRVSWFINNGWHRYTYYAVGSSATLYPTPACTAPGYAGCLTVNGLDSSSGNAADKRLVLVLMGRAVGAQPRPSANPTDFLESHSTGTSIYAASVVSSSFNDRIATCPFKYTPQSGIPIAICD